LQRKAHLLLVDDNPNTLASLSRAFRMEGHEVTVCENANRAVELLRTEPFDLILSDVVMPGKSGIEGRAGDTSAGKARREQEAHQERQAQSQSWQTAG
jgi:DNA-binding NtrC family response regulator